MTNFKINGFTVNGIDDTPFLSMNTIPKRHRTPEQQRMIEHYKTLSLMNAIDNKLDLSGLNRSEMQELFEGIDTIKGAVTVQMDALFNRINITKH